MPRILLVKTSSMGDVIHNLPVVTDIRRQLPETIVDWVVEKPFAEIPALHPGVRRIIPVALRSWRKSPLHRATRQEIRAFRAALSAKVYDVVLDTQGLVKSAFIASLAHGERHGYAWGSAREPLASCFYHRRFKVDRALHAVERNRLLAAYSLGYDIASLPLDYGIHPPAERPAWLTPERYAVLLTATSRDDKLWPEGQWIKLGSMFANTGFVSVLPWGAERERVRSSRIADAIPYAQLPPALSLTDAARLLGHAAIVVGVDTGLTHLAAALGANVVALHSATSPGLTGVNAGKRAVNLGGQGRPPPIGEVWETASRLINLP